MRIRFGTYGFLDNHLLEMISVSGGYEFFTSDNHIIQKYNFKEKKVYTQIQLVIDFL